MVVKNKEWYKSRTMWANAFFIIGGALTWLSGELQSGGVITIIGIVNVVLRLMTDKKIN